MTTERLIAWFLGATMLLGMVAAFFLALQGSTAVAAFLGVVSAIAGLLCPSPVFQSKGGDKS